MRFTFENLGPIRFGECELGSLTVVSGLNNVGKTYLTYALYGFFSRWRQYVPRPRLRLDELMASGHQELDLKSHIDRRSEALNKAATTFVTNLSSVLAAEPGRYSTAAIRIGELPHSGISKTPYESSFTLGPYRAFLAVTKPKDSTVLTLTAPTERGRPTNIFSVERILANELQTLLYGDLFPNTYIASTERTGAVAFRGELNLTKNRLIEAAHQINPSEDLNPSEIMGMLAQSGYALPVRDNVDFLNQLSNIQSSVSLISQSNPEIIAEFSDLIGGDYKIDKQGVLGFSPKSMKGRLRMGESSSAVRSMVILSYYLNALALPGDLLMIDEPELNLHPANQRRLARLLVRLVNCGIRVFVTTHSDYVLREINSLIQMQGRGEKAKATKAAFGYKDNDGIDARHVRIYTIAHGEIRRPERKLVKGITINESKVDPILGIDRTTFDDVIIEMNDLQAKLQFLD